MHLQASVEDFDVFARSLSIGAETMVMHFEPDRPMYDRYQVDHDFLSRRDRRRGRDDQPRRERVLPLGVQLLRDDREGRRRVADRLRERVSGRRADEPALLLPVGDPGARPLVGVLLRDRTADADQPDHARLLRDRRPRGPLVRGEARRVPEARRRLLPDRRVRRVLRHEAAASRRGAGRVGRGAGLRPACSSTRSSPPSRSTSRSTSSPTTAACSRPGHATSAGEPLLRPRAPATLPRRTA